MSLESIVSKVKRSAKYVKDYFVVPSESDKLLNYAIDNYITPKQKEILMGNRTDEELKVLNYSLESKLNQNISLNKDNLDRVLLKLGVIPGVGVLFNDLFHFYQGTSVKDLFSFGYGLVIAKALLELPAMYEHVKYTHDLKGAIEFLGTKVLSATVPIIGPALDLNVTQRVIKKKVVKDSVNDFLKEQGVYSNNEQYIQKESFFKGMYNKVRGCVERFLLEKSKPVYYM